MHALLSGPVALLFVVAQAAFFLYLLRGLFISSRDDDWLGAAGRPRRPPPRRGYGPASAILETAEDFATGAMTARVIAGPYLGRRIEELTRVDCMRLYEYCRVNGDDYAAAFVELYMRRRFAGGDFGAGASHGGERQARREPPHEAEPESTDGAMTRARAFRVLGLPLNASEADIHRAHRALIMKHHPDRGGSHAAAALINQAKDFLVARAN